MNEQFYYWLVRPEELQALTQNEPALLLTAHQVAMDQVAAVLRGRLAIDVVLAGDDTQWPAELRMVLIDLALYHLYTRHVPDQLPAVRSLRYAAALQWLRDVASGVLVTNLPLATPLAPIPSNTYNNPYLAGSNPKQQHQ